MGATSECDLGRSPLTTAHLDALDHEYIKWVIAHEVGHQLELAWKTKPAGLKYHHSPSTRRNNIMEKAITVDNITGGKKFYIDI